MIGQVLAAKLCLFPIAFLDKQLLISCDPRQQPWWQLHGWESLIPALSLPSILSGSAHFGHGVTTLYF